MMVNLTDKGVNEIVNDFDLFYIDIWGVLHNGIKLNEDAVNVLSELDNFKISVHLPLCYLSSRFCNLPLSCLRIMVYKIDS